MDDFDIDDEDERTIRSKSPLALFPEPPMVGRDKDLDRILSSVKLSLRKGQSKLLGIFGGLGSGKTTLLDHLSDEIQDQHPSAIFIRTSCQKTSEDPYDPLPKILQSRFDFDSQLDEIGKRIAVSRLVGKVFGEEQAKWVTEVSHLLGHLAGIPFPQSPVLRSLEGEPQRLQTRIHSSLQRFIEADSKKNGLIWIIDDLHHASPEVHLLLGDIASRLTSSPFVVIATGSPSLQNILKVAQKDRTVLSPLPDGEMIRLFSLLLAGLPEPPLELSKAAIEKASGNPASMREIARLLIESGVVDISSDPWRTDLSKLAATDLPVSLDEALKTRRQRLEPRIRAMLERAAVIGEVFWDEAILALSRGSEPYSEHSKPAQIWPDDSETMLMESALRRLEEAEFVVPLEGSEFPRVREYAFRHAGLRDQIYAEIGKDQLRTYHLLAAQWFDIAPTNLREQFLEQIADHWERGGEKRKAAKILIEAAGQARSRSLNQKAIRLYERGLVGLASEDRITRIEALHDMGSVHELVGEYDASVKRLTEMLRDAWVLVHRGKAGAALNKMGRIYRARGDYTAAKAYFQRGLSLFRAADDTRGVASSLDDLGNLYWLLGHYQRALDHSAEALEIRRSLNDRRGEAVSLLNIGHIEKARGYLSEADACYREALEISHSIGDRDTECKALNSIGIVFQTRGDQDQAIEIWRDALALAEDIGDRRMESFLLNNLGEILTLVGDRQDAERCLLDCEALAKEREDRRVLSEVYRNLGALMTRHNEVDRAREYLEHSLKTAREMGSKEAIGLSLRGLGELSGQTLTVDVGKSDDDATSYFDQALEIFEQIGNEVEVANTLNALGTYWLERDDLEKAQDSLKRARKIYDRLDSKEKERIEQALDDIADSIEEAKRRAEIHAQLSANPDGVPVMVSPEREEGRSDDTVPNIPPGALDKKSPQKLDRPPSEGSKSQ